MNLPRGLELNYRKNIACLSSVRQAAESFWAIPLHQYYTKHDIFHSEKVIKIVGKLIECLNEPLNELERFILLTAIYLHDLGMQSPAHSGIKNKDNYTSEDLEIIRANHHIATEKMIYESVRPNSSFSLGLNGCSPHLIQYIATVAKYHRKEDINFLKNTSISGETIRIPLLCALIRFGDELDVDHERVNIDTTKLIDIPVEEQYHWMSHHYVQSVDIINGRIKFYFSFPTKYKGTVIVNKLKDKSIRAIEDRLNALYEIFESYGMRLYKKVEIENESYLDILDNLSDELEEFLNNDKEISPKPQITKRREIKIRYSFIDMGTNLEESIKNELQTIKKNRIFIDTGGCLRTGVIDLHELEKGIEFQSKYYKSTAAGVLAAPNLILENLTENADEIEIVAHKSPDFDCFTSAYLVKQLLETNELPINAIKLVEYTEVIDNGMAKLDKGFINTPFAVATAIKHLIQRKHKDLSKEQCDTLCMKRGIELIEYLMERLNSIKGAEVTLFNYSIIEWDGNFKEELDLIKDDYNLYKEDFDTTVENTSTAVCQKIKITLPILGGEGKLETVYGVIWNRAPKCIFHKYWARSDSSSPDEKGYNFTVMPLQNRKYSYEDIDKFSTNRYIISVSADSDVYLKGLATLLEELEVKKELQLFEDNNSILKLRSRGQWYDGMSYNYKIIDSPAATYSLLSIDEVKQVIGKYAKVEYL